MLKVLTPIIFLIRKIIGGLSYALAAAILVKVVIGLINPKWTIKKTSYHPLTRWGYIKFGVPTFLFFLFTGWTFPTY